MYAHKGLRPAKLSIGDGESIDVLVSLTQEFNTLDSRSRIVGWLQARTWLEAPVGTEIFDLSLEDRDLKIFFTRQPLSFSTTEESDNLVEDEFIDAKSMKDLTNGN